MVLPYDSFSSGGLNISGSGIIQPSTIWDCTGAAGTAGQVLSSTGTALQWISASGDAISCSTLAAKGDLISATAASTPVALTVGTDGQVLTACAACTTGLTWAAAGGGGGGIPDSTLTAKGDLISATAASTPTALSVGTDGQVLTACSACTSGLTWAAAGGDASAIPCSVLTAKGSIVTATAASTPVGLAVGTNGQYLVANSLCTQGIQWLTPPFLNCNLLTAKGALVSASAANTPSTIPVGTNGQVLTACSTCLGGMTWTTASGGAAATPTAAGTVFGCTMSAGLLNTALGNCALSSPGSFGCNTAVGFCALASSTAAYFNTAVGNCAGKIINGTNNTFVGNRAGGAFAVGGFTQSSATAIGAGAMANSTGAGSTVVGQSAGNYMTGNYNVGMGTSALHGSFSGFSGAFNIGIGDFAGCGLSTGCCNIAIGFQSLATADTAVCNTGVGFQTLCNVTSGVNNIAIGPNSGTVISGDTSGIVNLTTESNRIVMGNFNHTCAQIKIGWTVTSDERDKAIDPNGVPYGLAFVNQIDPIAYCWCDRSTGSVTENRVRFGFSAQNICSLETETENPVIIGADDPEHLTFTDQMLLPVMVNAIKELSAKVDSLQTELETLKANG